MKQLTLLLLLTGLLNSMGADSGDSLHGVPDPKKDETSSVIKMPRESKPLSYFLKNKPELVLDEEANKVTSINWKGVGGHHSSIQFLGSLSGHSIFEVRYLSSERVRKGDDFSDVLLLLAKKGETKEGVCLFEPVYCTSSGPGYNRTAKFLEKGYPQGAIEVTIHFGNTGVFERVYLRGENDKIERFTPKKG